MTQSFRKRRKRGARIDQLFTISSLSGALDPVSFSSLRSPFHLDHVWMVWRKISNASAAIADSLLRQAYRRACSPLSPSAYCFKYASVLCGCACPSRYASPRSSPSIMTRSFTRAEKNVQFRIGEHARETKQWVGDSQWMTQWNCVEVVRRIGLNASDCKKIGQGHGFDLFKPDGRCFHERAGLCDGGAMDRGALWLMVQIILCVRSVLH